MKLGYLGQQGWLVEEKNTRILIDPVLTDAFGSSRNVKFKIYPPRLDIDLNLLGRLDAVLITNEHLDHFHFPSLLKLERTVHIYVGDYTPNFVAENLQAAGFKVTRCKHNEWVDSKDLLFKFYVGCFNTPFWERRVYHPYIISKSDPGARLIIQSDTLINPLFIKDIKEKKEKCPTLFVATNNSQIPHKGVPGAFDNIYPSEEDTSNQALQLLSEVTCTYTQEMPEVRHVFFSGGAYIYDSPNSIPFKYSDIKSLGNLASQLSIGRRIHGLEPGESFNSLTGEILHEPWSNLDASQKKIYAERLNSISGATIPSILKEAVTGNYKDEEETIADIKLIENEHALLAVGTALGKVLLSLNNFIKGSLESERLLIIYRLSPTHKKAYHLNLNKVTFEETDIDEEAILKYPFGVEWYLKDFASILKGEIQVWEVATTNMRQWYLGDKLDSPIAFFYKYFAEQIRPELANKITQRHVLN